MGTIDKSLDLLDSFLGNPKANRPTVDQRWTQLLTEFQQLVNELNNTSLPWLTQETVVSLNSGDESYLVPANIGKVLFVYANRSDNVFGPFAMEFADFASVSSDFYLFSPLDYGIARDFNETFAVPFPAQIAFYKQGGQTYFRLPPFGTGIESVTIVSSVGDWLDGLSSEDSFIIPGHAHLAITRAAQNLLPMTEWAGDDAYNDKQQIKFERSLERMERRYKDAWIIAKRSIHADTTESYRYQVGDDQ